MIEIPRRASMVALRFAMADHTATVGKAPECPTTPILGTCGDKKRIRRGDWRLNCWN
jgi:hypothetical protein